MACREIEGVGQGHDSVGLRGELYVEAWAAIVADPATPGLCRLGASAEESGIPASMRRRLSPFARMAIACGLNLVGPAEADLVFASQYGDLALAAGLLGDVVTGGLLSPAAFSLSVHNAPAGVLDIFRGSRIGHTAIAGGAESLTAGLIEAWLRLQERGDVPVAMVFADEAPPWEWTATGGLRPGIALGLRLTTVAGPCRLRFQPRETVRPTPSSTDVATRITRFLSGEGDGEVPAWQSQGCDWCLEGLPS